MKNLPSEWQSILCENGLVMVGKLLKSFEHTKRIKDLDAVIKLLSEGEISDSVELTRHLENFNIEGVNFDSVKNNSIEDMKAILIDCKKNTADSLINSSVIKSALNIFAEFKIIQNVWEELEAANCTAEGSQRELNVIKDQIEKVKQNLDTIKKFIRVAFRKKLNKKETDKAMERFRRETQKMKFEIDKIRSKIGD